MITNLVASIVVTVVTNVTERLPTHSEPAPCPDAGAFGAGISCGVYHSKTVPDANPKEKWIDYAVKEVTTATFKDFNLPPSVYERPITNWSEHLVLRQDWKKE